VSDDPDEDVPWQQRYPYTVRCPFCGVGPGLMCIDTRGWVVVPHTERRLLGAQ